ncbi:general substrate transporter [Syncephalis plumigaleata]|nr:general substrate transporter [Syncephalis plumigaleata]
METAAENLAVFCVGRTLAGAEISPARLRGSMVAVMPFAIAIGAVTAFMVNYLCSSMSDDIGWRIPFAVQSSIAMLMLTGVMLMPRSPRWLLAHSHDKDANIAFCKLNGLPPEHHRVISEFDEMRVAILADRMDNMNIGLGSTDGGGSWRVLFSREMRRYMIVTMTILALQQPSELTANIYYFPGILRAAGIDNDKYATLLGTGGIGMILLVTSGVGVLTVDRLGRRPLMIGGSIGMTVAFVILTTLAACRKTMPDNTYAIVACIVIIAGAMSWRIILPNRLRSRAISLACSLYWLVKLLMVQLAPFLLGRIEWGTYLVLAAIYALVALWVYRYLPETMETSLEKLPMQLNVTTTHMQRYIEK